MAISLRLDERLTRKLVALAKVRGISKSALIRNCLAQYLANEEGESTAWDLGKRFIWLLRQWQGQPVGPSQGNNEGTNS